LEPYVFDGIDLEFTKNLLEVGCGVGAQTKILCRRFPDLKVDSIDLSEAQLEVAAKYLKPEISKKRVHLYQGDAQKLNLKQKNYEAAFLCWFLEHVPEPLTVLKKVRSHLQKGAKIYCSEVFNQTLFLEPYSPAFIKYWFEFNDLQYEMKGHPFVGAQLGHLLQEAGFEQIEVEPRPFHFDSREPEKRSAFMKYFFEILMSAKDKLLEEKRVDQNLLNEMQKEMKAAQKAKSGVFFYSYMRATARA
jgi:ubiquinone/menaquinone biosynthesis C-methylase UbiE